MKDRQIPYLLLAMQIVAFCLYGYWVIWNERREQKIDNTVAGINSISTWIYSIEKKCNLK